MSETAILRRNSGGAESRHALSERKDDLYETPDVAVHTLLRHEATLGQHVWEPACGPGAIVRILRQAGKTVTATDLVDYRCPDSEAGVDFLMESCAPIGVQSIVTNPPFKLADEFIRHGLTLVPTVVMLLRLAYLEGACRMDLLSAILSACGSVSSGFHRCTVMAGTDPSNRIPDVPSRGSYFAGTRAARPQPSGTSHGEAHDRRRNHQVQMPEGSRWRCR